MKKINIFHVSSYLSIILFLFSHLFIGYSLLFYKFIKDSLDLIIKIDSNITIIKTKSEKIILLLLAITFIICIAYYHLNDTELLKIHYLNFLSMFFFGMANLLFSVSNSHIMVGKNFVWIKNQIINRDKIEYFKIDTTNNYAILKIKDKDKEIFLKNTKASLKLLQKKLQQANI
jgi:hypothetical protein